MSSFSAYFALDAYSTHNKLMGRQKNGEHFLQALADRAMLNAQNPETIWAGFEAQAPQSLRQLLLNAGFRGRLRWHPVLKPGGMEKIGVLYYPAPPTLDLACLRASSAPGSCSLMGLTHTLSSAGALDQIRALALPPFESWDALICTSKAARELVKRVIDTAKDEFSRSTGATRFPSIQLPIIPLGVQASRFQPNQQRRQRARDRWSLSPSDFVALFVGRLTFHAKANPAPMYQALQALAKSVPARRVICLESGQFPNVGIKGAFEAAQQVIAPDVVFITVDGKDADQFQAAWSAADVFLSCSDNVQETFGLTPLEAMAAELPVVVSDWNGYKDTVVDQQTGFRIPTYLPAPGCRAGETLAVRHAMQVDTYDFYIGRVSMTTVIDPERLQAVLIDLAMRPEFARAIGKQARAHVLAHFDWSVIVPQYEALAIELQSRRLAAVGKNPRLLVSQPWSQRPDPFALFSHFATAPIDPLTEIKWHPDAAQRWESIKQLSMVRYGFNPELGDDATMAVLIEASATMHRVADGLVRFRSHDQDAAMRMIMLAAKLDLCRFKNPSRAT
ncbi:MAG: glycosyltransferase [Betaproteobacteria bacterium]|nr:glycosyltransferase [Betaproteobacteria bacterium]NDD11091.1 glycosyltransferase [Betaproteobacteria bacterium]